MQARIEPGIDVDEGLALAHLVGWRYVRPAFARTLSLADGAWSARDAQGVLIGMATCVVWGELAWIGSMVVHPRVQRQGLGRALLRKAIAHAEERGARTLGLDATPEGRALYGTEGFRPEWGESRKWTRDDGREPAGTHARADGPAQRHAHAIYPVSPAEIMELLGYDKPRFGGGRGRYLGALMSQAPHRSFVAVHRKTGAFEGHGFATEHTIGPIMADTPAAAAQLLRALETAGAPARAIVPRWNPDAERVFAAAGYAPEPRSCVRMARGDALRGAPGAVYAVGAWALG